MEFRKGVVIIGIVHVADNLGQSKNMLVLFMASTSLAWPGTIFTFRRSLAEVRHLLTRKQIKAILAGQIVYWTLIEHE